MKSKTIVTIVIAVTIGIISLVGVIWGVVTHTEGGLLTVCWRSGIAYYADTGQVDQGEGRIKSCPTPHEIIWDQSQIPLSISMLSSKKTPLKGDSPEVKALSFATRDLNKQLGFNLFEIVPYGHASDAELQFGGAFREGGMPLGYVSHAIIDGNIRAYSHIRSDVLSNSPLTHAVLQHELLHIAGAAHDPMKWSCMYPYTRDDWQTMRLRTAHVTDHDKKLFNTLYNSPNVH